MVHFPKVLTAYFSLVQRLSNGSNATARLSNGSSVTARLSDVCPTGVTRLSNGLLLACPTLVEREQRYCSLVQRKATERLVTQEVFPLPVDPR